MDIVTPRSKAELEDALNVVVSEAYKHGVEVADGAYSLIHQDSSIPDWDVTIIRLEEDRASVRRTILGRTGR